MNNTLPKIQTAPVSGADVLAVLDRRLGELRARRVTVTELIIGLEKTTSAAPNGIGANIEQAEALLNGVKFVASRFGRSMSDLSALHAERGIIDAALKLGGSRQHRLATERATEVWASYFGEIAEIEKRRVLLALELQRTNRAREKLREKIAKAGGAGYLSTDGVDLLGLGDVGDEIQWAADRLIADGIATRLEIKRGQV